MHCPYITEEKLETREKYPWIDKTDEGKYITERKIQENT